MNISIRTSVNVSTNEEKVGFKTKQNKPHKLFLETGDRKQTVWSV